MEGPYASLYCFSNLSDIVVSKRKSDLLRVVVFKGVGGILFTFQMKSLRASPPPLFPTITLYAFEFWFCPHNFTGTGPSKVTSELPVTK